MTHLEFPSLTQFNDVFARETWDGLTERRAITYRAKIKLHGTNMSISVDTDGSVTTQARRTIITPENDIDGFASWADPSLAIWATAQSVERTTFYGEWAGPKIKKGDAVQRTDKRRFYIFAVGLGVAAPQEGQKTHRPRIMITDPTDIASLLPQGIDRDEVRALPFEDEEPILTFDFNDEEQVSTMLDALNESVDLVAKRDPYISRTFGVDHPGEGFVLIPHATLQDPVTLDEYARTAFKAKTEKHRVRKQPKPATVREPLPATALQFIETFVTPQRVDQAIDEVCGGQPDIKATGKIIGWMTSDLQKEAGAELEALDIPFDRLKGDIAAKTRTHFMARVHSARNTLST